MSSSRNTEHPPILADAAMWLAGDEMTGLEFPQSSAQPLKLSDRRCAPRSGFTLLEMLVVVLSIGILMMLLLPTLSSVREHARMVQCENSLRQLGIGLHSYEQAHNVLPPGCVDTATTVRVQDGGYKLSWMVQLLPHLELGNLYRRIDFQQPNRPTLAAIAGLEEKLNSPFADVWSTGAIPLLLCPSNADRSYPGGGLRLARTTYAGCSGSGGGPISDHDDGMLYLNSSESLYAVPDGTSQTILLGETRLAAPESGWMVGDRSTLRTTAVGAATGSEGPAPLLDPETPAGFSLDIHGNRSQFVFCDGSVRRISADVLPEVFMSLGSRNDSLNPRNGEF